MIIGIVGPTGSGKSSLGIKLAKEIKGEIISCDSVQIYKGFNIGSGKVNDEEIAGIRHHLIDIKEGNESFTVADFIQLAEGLVREIEGRGKVPIIVGGTGLYYRAFAYRYVLNEEKKEEEDRLRDKFLNELQIKGVDYLYTLLNFLDEESGRIIDPKHSSRIIRALIYYHIHGRSIAGQNISALGVRNDLLGIYLDVDRELLYGKINVRVDKMMVDGLLGEVETLLSEGISKNSPTMKTIGYKEMVEYLEGLVSLEEAVDNIKRNSRRYAKRQITWFKKHEELNAFPYNNLEDQGKIIDFVKGKLGEIY